MAISHLLKICIKMFMNISEDIRKILLSLGLSLSLCPNHRSLKERCRNLSLKLSPPTPFHSWLYPSPYRFAVQCHGGECCHDIQAGLWPEEDHSEPSHTAKLGQDPTWRLAHCILLQALTYLQWFSLDAPTGPPVGGDPTPRCRSTLVPFRVGAGPQGPTRLPSAGYHGIIPLAVVAAPLHTLWGHYHWAKL